MYLLSFQVLYVSIFQRSIYTDVIKYITLCTNAHTESLSGFYSQQK